MAAPIFHTRIWRTSSVILFRVNRCNGGSSWFVLRETQINQFSLQISYCNPLFIFISFWFSSNCLGGLSSSSLVKHLLCPSPIVWTIEMAISITITQNSTYGENLFCIFLSPPKILKSSKLTVTSHYHCKNLAHRILTLGKIEDNFPQCNTNS